MKKAPVRSGKGAALGKELDKLALAIAKELSQAPAPPLDEKIAAFKALTTYYAMVERLPPPPDDTKAGFNGFAQSLAALGRNDGRRRAANGAARPNGTAEAGDEE